MTDKPPLYKYELLEELPDGTLKYHVVKTRGTCRKDKTSPRVYKHSHHGLRRTRFGDVCTQIEQYLFGSDRAQTTKEITEGVGVTSAVIYNTLQLMEAFGTVQKVKSGRSYYYFLKGVYDDEQISTMLPPKKVKPNDKPQMDREREDKVG